MWLEALSVLVADSVEIVLGTVIVGELVFVVLPEKLLGIKRGSDAECNSNELGVTLLSSDVDGNNLTEPLASDGVAESPLAFVDWSVEELARTLIIDDHVCIGLLPLMLLFDDTVKLLCVK